MDIKQRLAANESRRNRLEMICIAVFVVGLVALAGWLIYDRDRSDEIAQVVLESLLLTIASGYGFMRLVLVPGMKRLCDWLAPEWIIEDCGSVVKVHGSVRMIDFDRVEQRMLSVRVGFRPVDKAWERFGCTMAAVPASAAYLAAQHQFEDLRAQLRA